MRIYRFILLAVIAAFASAISIHADNVKKVKGEYTFYGDSNHSLEECRRRALEGARIEALKAEYGTTVSNDTYSHDTTEGDSYFSSLSATEVRGEWIADDGAPEYEVSIDNDGHYIVKCRVAGRARAIGNEAVDFEAVTLRGGNNINARATSFESGDDMRLFFRAPVDGTVAVFLVDDRRTVWNLLPYTGDGAGEMRTRHGKDYVFFSAERPDGVSESSIVDELVMTTDREAERNELYVVFSPKTFSLPDMKSSDGVPSSLPLDSFNRWLADSRRRDAKMGVKRIGIEIKGK